MNRMRCLPLLITLSLAISTPLWAEAQDPAVLPTRDVDISYQITRPNQPTIIERRRWSASEHLQRVDGPDKSTTIFDRDKGEFTLVNPSNRTYRRFEGVPRMPMAPGRGVTLTRGGESVIAGLHCVDWSWMRDEETHTACLTPDGVLLRLVIDGNTVMQARSVNYGQQRKELFRVPSNYTPALAPEGGSSQ